MVDSTDVRRWRLLSSCQQELIASKRHRQRDKFETARFELHALLGQPALSGVPLLVVRGQSPWPVAYSDRLTSISWVIRTISMGIQTSKAWSGPCKFTLCYRILYLTGHVRQLNKITGRAVSVSICTFILHSTVWWFFNSVLFGALSFGWADDRNLWLTTFSVPWKANTICRSQISDAIQSNVSCRDIVLQWLSSRSHWVLF